MHHDDSSTDAVMVKSGSGFRQYARADRDER